MIKVAINTTFGGFQLTEEASKMLNELKGYKALDPKYGFLPTAIPRHDPDLIEVIRKLGPRASKGSSNIIIVEVYGNKYIIEEYDGSERTVTPDQIEWIEVNDDH